MLAFLYNYDTHHSTIELRCSIATIIELVENARIFAHRKNLRVGKWVLTGEEHYRLGAWVYESASCRSHEYEFRSHRIMGAPFEVCDCTRGGLCHRQEPAPDRRPSWSPLDYRWDLGSDDRTVTSVLQDPRTIRPISVQVSVQEKKPKRPPSKLHPLVKLDEELRALDPTPDTPSTNT